MKDQAAVLKHLLDYFERAKQKNARYSMRSLAKKLDVSQGTLSRMLSGKRYVSRKLAEKVVVAIGLDPSQRTEVLSLFPRRKKVISVKNAPTTRYQKVDMAAFQKIFEWEYFAFLSLLKCVDFSNDPEWIGDRLGLSTTKVEEMIQNLLDVKMIAVQNGKMKRVEDFRTTDDVPNETIQKAHLQSLNLAKQALLKNSVKHRDFSSITFAIHPEHIPQAKEEIRAFQDRLLDLFSERPATEVYRLSMELFPLTQMPSGEA